MAKWQRSFFQPVLPLGEDGRRVTGSKEHIALSRMAAGEGMVLLKNEKNALPIRRGTKVALFGKGTVDYVKGGGGSGDVTVEYIRNLYEGMKIKEDEGKVEVFDKLAKYYEKDIQKQYADGAVPGMTVEPELPDELLNEAREYTDTAVITICRFSGEGWDRKCEAAQDGYVLDGEEKRNSELSAKIFENGDFCLTNAENAMVEKVKKEELSFLDGVRMGTFTVPGDGDIDFDPIFKVLEESGYTGYMVVEAEQDPAKANPLEYALKARKFISEKTGL